MRQTLRTLSIVACLAIGNAANVYADPVYTALPAPFGFLHVGNKNLNKQLIGGVDTTFSVNQMASLIEGNYSYTVKAHNRDSEYELYLPDDLGADIKAGLSQYFGNKASFSAWLEYQGLGEAVDGANLCHYQLKAYFGKKAAPDVLIADIPVMMRRSLPTFAALDTQADHETHLALDRLADAFDYKGHAYQFCAEDVGAIRILADVNPPIDADEHAEPPIVAHPTSVVRTYWDEKAKKMSAVLFVEDEAVYECEIPLAPEHD
jgi:hypothetical protein